MSAVRYGVYAKIPNEWSVPGLGILGRSIAIESLIFLEINTDGARQS
jgi:hypothetical protein